MAGGRQKVQMLQCFDRVPNTQALLGGMPTFTRRRYVQQKSVPFNLDRAYRDRRIAILSSSQAVMRALSSNIIGLMLAWDCQDRPANWVLITWLPCTGKQRNDLQAYKKRDKDGV